MKKSGVKVQSTARQNHRFNNPPHMISSGRQYSPSGNLERSISYTVRKVRLKDAIALRVYLDGTMTTSNGFNYGFAQHDGMGTGFKLSPASPQRSTTGRNNLEYDHFLWEAYLKELPTLKKNLKNVPRDAARKAGLK
jgi:hypothetical protein